MGLFSSVKIHSLLMRLALSSSKPRSDPLVVERQGYTPAGTEFNIYQHRRKELTTCILLHGVTVNGGRDQRLITFSRNLAHFGVTCVVPTLRGLASCRWEADDLDEFANIVVLTTHAHQSPVGVIGFSFGGSYALRVATRSEIAGQIKWMITFGAYHTLEDVFETCIGSLARAPHTNEEWDHAIYQHLVFLYGNRDSVSLPSDLWQEIELLLQRFCCEASLEEKRRFYDRYLCDLDIAEVVRQSANPERCQQLSPAEKMDGITCPVTLIHDRHDRIVPPVHSERLFSELQALHKNNRHQLVLTSLLSHVSPSDVLNIPEIMKLVNALTPIVQG